MIFNILVLMPFFASAFYGLSYVFMERTLGVHLNPTTFLFFNTLAEVIAIMLLIHVQGEHLDIRSATSSWPIFLMVIAAATLPIGGWVLTIYSIRHLSALYTALAETSYPLFTLAFGFLIFGIRQFNMTTFLGGALILVGAGIMVYGKNQAEGHE
ncbi:MAG: EamA family transporter [Alphaproteobacteria bacterium]|nr:EamA family transporter [Alphaproteobacteria bacterium]